MALEIGYNVKHAQDLVDDIAESYNKIKTYTKEGWHDLSETMRKEWVGEDEQDFEQEFINKICTIYEETAELVKSAVGTIGNLANNWINFQKTNTIFKGKGNGVSSSSGTVEIPTIAVDNPIVSYKSFTIGESEDRGLKTAGSAAEIQAKVSEYVGTIKSKVNGLFDQLNVDSAFFGSQVSSIKAYITQTNTSIQELSTAVKDMYNHVNTLANTSYSSSLEEVNEEFNTATSEMAAATESLGESKWS